MKAIILGSRGRVRRLTADMSYPQALEKIDPKGKSIMAWNINALKEFGVTEIIYIGGYHIEKVIQAHPSLKFYYYKDWKDGSDLEALKEAERELKGEILLINSDVTFRANALKLLCRSKNHGFTVGGVDCLNLPEREKGEYDLLDNKHVFSGMMYIPDALAGYTLKAAGKLMGAFKNASLFHLIEEIRKDKKQVEVVDIKKYWSPLNKDLSLVKFVLGTKAETLERLRPLVRKSIILPQVRFAVKNWKNDPERIISNLQNVCGKGKLVVRSSAIGEDSWAASWAGRFYSELNVDGSNKSVIEKAVSGVIASYYKNGAVREDNEVLVQPIVSGVSVSGVLLTKDMQSRAPYWIINYDNKTQRTDTVTSGNGGEVETKIVYRGYTSKIDNGWIDDLIDAAKEIESLLNFDEFDIEFAIGSGKNVYILQVRPLTVKRDRLKITSADFSSEIRQLKEFVKNRMDPSPYVFGETNLLGEMPDWNPSEMIGASPKPLALSLYQKLITDWAWAEARARCGYRNVRPEPLMLSLGGKPFIDVRGSFNSFLPEDLDHDISRKLIDHSIKYLRLHPEFHDKVEFEVAFNCYTFDFDEKLEGLSKNGFNAQEIAGIKNAYLRLTDTIVSGKRAPISEQLYLLKKIRERSRKAAKDERISEVPRHINALLSDCIEYGIIPFSILARYAFISIAFLKSMVKKGIFSSEEYEIFVKNIPTVAAHFSRDMMLFRAGKLQKKDFIEKYGHLRPNSYDITSMNYTDMLNEGMFSGKVAGRAVSYPDGKEDIIRRIWAAKEKMISAALEEAGFKSTTAQLFDFITAGIPAREKGKMEFSWDLNLVLEKISQMGKALGFTREDMSYVSVERILRLATNSPSSVIENEFERKINYEKKRYFLTRSLRLPALIYGPQSVECFDMLKCHPNYITRKKVRGRVIDITGNKGVADIKGKIVAIKCADPGYEWIFSMGISGLITQYGGSASHMAIRAAEFGIPAAIGCGETIFDRIIGSEYVELDCGSQTIKTK